MFMKTKWGYRESAHKKESEQKKSEKKKVKIRKTLRKMKKKNAAIERKLEGK